MDENEFLKYFSSDEKRGEPRLDTDAAIYIEVESAEPGSKEPPKVVDCIAVDISANGLQVQVASKLTAGAIHPIFIELLDRDLVYKLIAEVRWVRENEDGYLVGLLLFESDGTEIIDWKMAVANRLQ